jgi:tRNA-specific 2-thiouridylase
MLSVARLKDGKLLRGIDNNKDQTYFLSQLSSKQLENVLFPVGDLEKKDVRKIAEEYELITAEKKDSTGICFIGERNFKKFLENFLPNTPGDIINIDSNECVGRHIGLMYYTIGQRRGLDLGGNKERLFVIGKDLKKNILYVALGDDNKYLYSTSALIEQVNWINPREITRCTAKFRYRQNDNDVEVKCIDDTHILVTYNQGIKAVTPGQACVLYDGEECLGGGIIKEIYKEEVKLEYL